MIYGVCDEHKYSDKYSCNMRSDNYISNNDPWSIRSYNYINNNDHNWSIYGQMLYSSDTWHRINGCQ